MATQLVFQQLLLGFLTVGLVVGVAALGVISTRAVVERRQQIGMLRALGFQREMVSWIFLIESSFVALLGIGLGAGLALIPASQMITDMAADIPGPDLPGAVDGDHRRVWAGLCHDPADHLAARRAGLAGHASRGAALRVSAARVSSRLLSDHRAIQSAYHVIQPR